MLVEVTICTLSSIVDLSSTMLARISDSACDLSLKEKWKNGKEWKKMEKWIKMEIGVSEWKGMEIHFSEWKIMEKTGKEHSEI